MTAAIGPALDRSNGAAAGFRRLLIGKARRSDQHKGFALFVGKQREGSGEIVERQSPVMVGLLRQARRMNPGYSSNSAGKVACA